MRGVWQAAGSMVCSRRAVSFVAVVAACAVIGCNAASTRTAASASPAADTTRYCAGRTATEIGSCVDVERIAADIVRIARPRPPGSPHWLDTQSLCAETFASLGYAVQQHRYDTGINVFGVRPGRVDPDARVVVGAHYDHIAGCAGADDNASGVAGVLELARLLASTDHPRTLMLACWDEEERGLLGSSAWVRDARARGEQIEVYFNFDAIGVRRTEPDTQRIPTGFELLFRDEVARLDAAQRRGDFIAIVTNAAARPYADAIAVHAEQRNLPHTVLEIGALVLATPIAIDLRRSDHAPFWDAGYPAIMITDTADFRTDTYHCQQRPDEPSTVDPAFTADVVGATASAVVHALHGTQPPRRSE
jgi:hypothetical protein